MATKFSALISGFPPMLGAIIGLILVGLVGALIGFGVGFAAFFYLTILDAKYSERHRGSNWFLPILIFLINALTVSYVFGQTTIQLVATIENSQLRSILPIVGIIVGCGITLYLFNLTFNLADNIKESRWLEKIEQYKKEKNRKENDESSV